jgi:hypothetical protein
LQAICNSEKRDRKRDKDSIKEKNWFGNDVELRKLNKREKICCEKSGNLFILSIF